MKTFSEFKKQMRVGLVFRCEHHERPAISGPREVVKVQTNAIAFKWGPEGKTGWFYYPKSVKEVSVKENSITLLTPDGKPVFTYHLDAVVA